MKSSKKQLESGFFVKNNGNYEENGEIIHYFRDYTALFTTFAVCGVGYGGSLHGGWDDGRFEQILPSDLPVCTLCLGYLQGYYFHGHHPRYRAQPKRVPPPPVVDWSLVEEDDPDQVRPVIQNRPAGYIDLGGRVWTGTVTPKKGVAVGSQPWPTTPPAPAPRAEPPGVLPLALAQSPTEVVQILRDAGIAVAFTPWSELRIRGEGGEGLACEDWSAAQMVEVANQRLRVLASQPARSLGGARVRASSDLPPAPPTTPPDLLRRWGYPVPGNGVGASIRAQRQGLDDLRLEINERLADAFRDTGRR